DGLYLLAHFGGVSCRIGNRQHFGIGGLATTEAAARDAGMVSGALVRGDGLGRVYAHAIDSVVAHRSVDLEHAFVHVPTGPGPHTLGRAARGDSVGREFSPGSGVRRIPRSGSGATGRRRLRSEYSRRHRWIA